MATVTENYTLTLPAGICRRIAKFCCDLSHTHVERQRLLNAAALFMRKSDGLGSAMSATVEAPMSSFLWLQSRMWKTSATDRDINRACVEISKQMGEQEFKS